MNDSYSASFSAFDTINATFSDALVSYIYPVDFDQNQMCTEILFDLSAITKCGDLLSTSDIKGEYPASKIRCQVSVTVGNLVLKCMFFLYTHSTW